jgi:hypothetical protein
MKEKSQSSQPERPIELPKGNETNNGGSEAVAGDAPILDIASLRLEGSAESPVATTRVITRIPVVKPSKEAFIQCHPDVGFELRTLTIKSEVDEEIYVVSPVLRSAEFRRNPAYMCAERVLVPYITTDGDVMVWPIKLPEDGRLDRWNESALVLVQRSRETWLRILSNQKIGHYEGYKPKGDLGEPQWPDLTFDQIFRIALTTRMIDRLDHPFLRRLRGEV